MEDKVIQNFKIYTSQFVDIPDEQIVSLFKLSTKVIYKKNDYFSMPEKPNMSIGFIAKGLFRAYIINKEKNKAVMDFVGENNIITSYSAIILNQLQPTYIQALEDSEIYEISREQFIKMWENESKWKEFLQKLTEIVCINLGKRFYDFSIYDAKTLYLKFLNDYKPYAERIKLGNIASYLGITQETLSRIRSSPL